MKRDAADILASLARTLGLEVVAADEVGAALASDAQLFSWMPNCRDHETVTSLVLKRLREVEDQDSTEARLTISALIFSAGSAPVLPDVQTQLAGLTRSPLLLRPWSELVSSWLLGLQRQDGIRVIKSPPIRANLASARRICASIQVEVIKVAQATPDAAPCAMSLVVHPAES